MSQSNEHIRLRSSARTNRGRVRQNNEDSIHLWADTRYVLAVVADGMGGAVAGEEASRIAVETVQAEMVQGSYQTPQDYRTVDEMDLADKLEDVIVRANLNIVERAMQKPELRGMGTTLTLAFARDTEVILAHVGDSRAYLVDGHSGDISQITTDHSFVQALVDAGHITPAEAEDHPMKNVLYRALGQSEDLDIDVIPDVFLNIGDRMVLCSDGLTLHLLPDEIADLAMASDDPNVIADALVDLANERGGRDNISVIVVVVEGDVANVATNNLLEDLQTPPPDDDSTLPITPITRSSTASTSNAPNPSAHTAGGNTAHWHRPTPCEGSDATEPLQ